MAWARIDDRLYTNPKLAGLSDSAFRLYVHSLSFSAAHGTDGALLGQNLALIWPGSRSKKLEKAAEELVLHGCWEETPDGWQIHDWGEFNPPAEKARAVAATKARSGTYGNHKRWHEERGKVVDGCRWCRKPDRMCDRTRDDDASQVRSQNDRTADRSRARSRPVPSQPSPIETADEAPPSPAHAREDDRPAADDGRACGGDPPARTAADLWAQHKRRTLYQAEFETIRACISRFGDEITLRAVAAAIDDKAEYPSRIELFASRIAAGEGGRKRAPPTAEHRHDPDDPYLKFANGGSGA